MHITQTMLDAGIRKAIEAGLLPRRCTSSESAVNREILRAVIKAVLEAAHDVSVDDTAARRHSQYISDLEQLPVDRAESTLLSDAAQPPGEYRA